MEYNLPSKLLPAILLIPFTGQEVIRSCKVDEQALLQVFWYHSFILACKVA